MNFRHYNTDQLSLDIIIKVTNINAVQGTDFLGLTLDEHLNWKAHIEKTNNKISSFCYALSVLSDVSSIKVARSAYYGNIYSLLTYGIIFWGDTVNIESTFVLQKRSLRIMYNMKSDESLRTLFKENKYLTLT
ncbi:putative RNA-directed DNA polymerase from transposon BS, partial [Operophtera brumata]